MTYSIVAFDNYNSVEGVPSCWLLKNGASTYAYFPKKCSATKLSNMIKEKVNPQPQWPLYKCTVLYQTPLYETMLSKAAKAELTDHLSSSYSETTFAANQDSSSDCDEYIPPTPPKKRGGSFNEKTERCSTASNFQGNT